MDELGKQFGELTEFNECIRIDGGNAVACQVPVEQSGLGDELSRRRAEVEECFENEQEGRVLRDPGGDSSQAAK